MREPVRASGPPGGPTERLARLAREVGAEWAEHAYYDDAERHMEAAWRDLIWPWIEHADFRCVVDLAAGHGRNTSKLLEVSRRIHVVDINEENIAFCQQRFAGDERLVFLHNDGFSLSGIAASTVTLVYCFDAMVHFDSDLVRAYLAEFRRVLVPGGLGFCHHSNYSANPAGRWTENPGIRNYMSQSLFAHYCAKEGLRVVRSQVLEWGGTPGLDCFTLFRKPFTAVLTASRAAMERSDGVRVLTSRDGRLDYELPAGQPEIDVDIVVLKHPWSATLVVEDAGGRALHTEDLFDETSRVERLRLKVHDPRCLRLRVAPNPRSRGTEAWIHAVECA